MRAFLVVVLFAASAFAGCLSDDGPAQAADDDVLRIDPADVPTGADVTFKGAEAVLEWADVSFPFEEQVRIPNGTTLVRMTTKVAQDVTVRSYMSAEETDRRRCNPDVLDAWNVGISGTHTCTGTALVDPPGTKWTLTASGPDDLTGTVTVTFSAKPLDGSAALLDVSQLSMPTFDLQETTGQYVASFDGTDLWVEVTLPTGDGPWPTVIASSPYNGQTGRISEPGGTPAMWGYFTHDWAKRGYAIVNADVRGFGLSDGCVEVWGENEQRDQAFLVDWVAGQAWSDGNVGFYGQSYVGTTPVAAAVQAPDALKAIIAVAPVINAYEDWHYGGVPNGENAGSPVAYQVLTDPPGQGTTPQEIAENAAKGLCDPTLVVRANDPRAVYDDYYEERNFKLRADQVEAAVLYTQGFEDSNVKSMMIPGWFNEIPAPKLGVFGHWVHQHPTRGDEEILFLGWMDEYVKGKDLGFDQVPPVEVSSNIDTLRTTDMWPDPRLPVDELWPDYAAGVIRQEPADDDVTVPLMVLPAGSDMVDAVLEQAPGAAERPRSSVTVVYDVPADFAVSGIPTLNVRGTLHSQGNAYLAAELYDVSDAGAQLVSYGMFNLAHEDGHDQYDPVVARSSDVDLPFLPTEWVFQEGHSLVIELRAVQAGNDGLSLPGPPGYFSVGDHSDGNGAFFFESVPMDAYEPMPRSAEP